jgi:hypothetical protein
LTTSAPRLARYIVKYGPAQKLVRSSTRKPENGRPLRPPPQLLARGAACAAAVDGAFGSQRRVSKDFLGVLAQARRRRERYRNARGVVRTALGVEEKGERGRRNPPSGLLDVDVARHERLESREIGAVSDLHGRNARGLEQLDDFRSRPRRKPWLGFREERLPFRSAQRGLAHLAGELGKLEQRANVGPVLAGERVDADVRVGTAEDAGNRLIALRHRKPETIERLLLQHRVRNRSNQTLERGDVDFDGLAALPSVPPCAQRGSGGVRPRNVLFDASADVIGRSFGVPMRAAQPPAGLQRDAGGRAAAVRAALAEGRQPDGDSRTRRAPQVSNTAAPRLSIRMSQPPSSVASRARSSSAATSTTTLCLPAFRYWNSPLPRSRDREGAGPHARSGSPPGGSTLVTRAQRSASSFPAYATPMPPPISTTRRPARAVVRGSARA